MKNELNKIFAASECPPGDVLRQYYEGKLAGSDKSFVEKHLASCEACSDELEGMLFINDSNKLEKTVAGLKEDINARLELRGKFFSLTFYAKVAAVITILFVASFVFYLTVNSDKTTSQKSISQNIEHEKFKVENSNEQKDMAEEKMAEASGKSTSVIEEKSLEKEANLKGGNKKQSIESIVAESASQNIKAVPAQDGTFGILAESKKGVDKTDKKELSQIDAGIISNSVSQTGSGKASVKPVVVDITEQKVSEDHYVLSDNSQVTTKTNKDISKKDDANKNIVADNRNQQNETFKTKEEKQEQKKDESATREKTKDEIKGKKQSDKEGRKIKRAEEGENDLALKEEVSDKMAKSTTNTTVMSDNKKKGKAESPKKNNTSGAGYSNMPSGNESGANDAAINKFKAGKYDEAVTLFQQIIADNSIDYKALYYEGVCYYELGKVQKAIGNFELVININSVEFAEDARWYIALCYIKLNDKETALKKLQEIISKSGKHKMEAEKKIDDLK